MQKDFNSVKAYVYWIKNNTTGIKYIGVRWGNVRELRTPNEDIGKEYFTSGKLKKDFKKNPENFKIKLISTFDTAQEAIDYENIQTKKVFRNKRYANVASYPSIINEIPPTLGRKHTKEALAKISLASKNRIVSKKTKEKTSKSMKGKKNTLGYKHRPESLLKISKGNKGKTMSPEAKLKIGLGNKGKKRSKETRAKISEIWNKKFKSGYVAPMKGRIPSSEHKLKIGLANKGKKRSTEDRVKISEAVSKLYKLGFAPMKGKKHSKEAIAKIKESSLKRKRVNGRFVADPNN